VRAAPAGYLIAMPTRERVNEFIEAVCTNNHADAIARFYTEDASMQENLAEPRKGLALLVERETKVLASVASVETHRPDLVMIDGDKVVIHWIFDFAHADGRKRRVDEVALQEWRGDKICRERFVYDPSTAAWK